MYAIDHKNPEMQNELLKFEAYYLKDYRNDINFSQYGLLNGLSGIILIQLSIFELTGDLRYKEEIISNVDKIIESLEQQESYTASFCTGLAGVGWMLLHLIEKKILTEDPESFLEDFDQILEEEVKELISQKNYDILHGSLGLGLYFLKREKKEVIEILIDFLSLSKEEFENEISWPRIEEATIFYDMGLAHGNASILYFLVKCYEKKVSQNKCLRLISGSINFYLQNINSDSEAVSLLPSKMQLTGYKNVENKGTSRLAWCYGDLGVLQTILLASYIIGEDQNTSTITSLLLRTTTRRAPESTNVTGACFCHGSSGIAYIYKKLYEKTGDWAFQDAAEFWLNQTLSFKKREEHLDYHLDNVSNQDWHSKANLLSGIGGIAILYLAFTYHKESYSWDEVFFLK